MLRSLLNREPSDLDEAIDVLHTRMRNIGPGSEEYPQMLEHLERLTKLKKNNKILQRVSPDTVLLVAGNLLGILVIVAYEQKHVVTSKGLNFILKTPTTQ